MKRVVVGFVAAMSVMLAVTAQAQSIKIVVPFAAGGPADMLARLLAPELQKSLATDVIVENHGGGGGVIANEMVARSAADGKTLLVGSLGSHVISASLRAKLPYDPINGFEGISLIGSVPSLLVVGPNVKANTLAELVALAKSGQKVTYGSAGPGTTMNISGEMLNESAGIKTTHVPYHGAGPAINDLLGGHIDYLCADFPVLLPLVQSIKVRALAMLGKTRSPLMPDIGTTAELGYPRFVLENWYGVLAPAGLSADVKAKVEKAVLDALQLPSVQERLKTGGVYGSLDSKAYQARLKADFAYWGAEIKKLGITGE